MTNNKLTLKQYIYAARKPIIVALLSSLFCTFPFPLILEVTIKEIHIFAFSVLNFFATAACLFWAGQLAYKKVKPDILYASLVGPILLFFANFLVSVVSMIHFYSYAEFVVKNFLVYSATNAATYLFLFPIGMGIAAFGAFLEQRRDKEILPSNQEMKADEK